MTCMCVPCDVNSAGHYESQYPYEMATTRPCHLETCYLGPELRLCLVRVPHSAVPQGVVSTSISLLFPASPCHDTVRS